MPVLNFDDKNQVKEYEEFLEKYDGVVSFTQSLGWTIVKNNWQKEAVYLKENDKIVAAMLILIQKVPRTNYTLMYAPRGPVCDPNDVDTVNKLMEEAKDLAKKYNACGLTIDPQILYDEDLVKKYKKNGYMVISEDKDHSVLVQPKIEARLFLEGKTEEDLLKEFSQKTRYNIKVAKKHGVTVRYSHNKEDLKKFYEIYKITAERDKFGKRDYNYFERMLEAFDEKHLRIYLTEHDGDTLSAAVAICFGKELFYLYGASSNEKRNLMPNYLMQMAMINWGLETKCKVYNFGGILSDDKENGLYRFKVGFVRENGKQEYIGEIIKPYKRIIYTVVKNMIAYRNRKAHKKNRAR